MVAGVRLVASCRDRAAWVKSTCEVGKFASEQRVDTHFSGSGKFVLAVTEIEYQIGLFEGQGVGRGIVPLFENLVADAPYYHGRMVAVTPHEVGEVTFMPLVKISGIVVGGLLSAPHVKGLIHHEKSHAVT